MVPSWTYLTIHSFIHSFYLVNRHIQEKIHKNKEGKIHKQTHRKRTAKIIFSSSWGT